MKALILAIILYSATLGQTIHPEHDHLADMEDDIRFKSVTFLNVDGHSVYYKRESRYGIGLGTFQFDSQTRWDRLKPTPRCMVALYCSAHEYLYAFYPCEAVKK
jgi:hypothetical protein